ncbi:MAG: ABC-type metal ion transport system, periplasmic component/surface adhesin [Candidatus Krumholzibacteriota bacterium]|nr:ABC-type metal ion transport system, periplasmic component/surface adhesin [Candidatus Krumholzibacteriota bacterium]
MRKNRTPSIFAFLAAALVTAPFFGSLPNAAASEKRVDCWVSILPQAYFLKSVGGERVNVRVMVGPGQVPHTYEPTARQLSELASTRLYFSVGVAFEEALVPRIQRNFRSVRIVDMTAGVEKRLASEDDMHDVETAGREDRALERDSDGDPHGHGAFDPHVWLSPRIAAIMARNTRDALVSSDPDGAETYRSNCRALEAELSEVDSEIAQALLPYDGRAIFVFHPAYGYFTDAYGLTQIAIEENGAAPGPRHLAEVIDRARALGTTTVFIQPQVSASYAETVAREIGARVVTLDPLAEEYIENLRSMAHEIASALAEREAR